VVAKVGTAEFHALCSGDDGKAITEVVSHELFEFPVTNQVSHESDFVLGFGVQSVVVAAGVELVVEGRDKVVSGTADGVEDYC
jgi:hypothetical protein